MPDEQSHLSFSSKAASAFCGFVLIAISVALINAQIFEPSPLHLRIAAALAALGLAIVASIFLPATLELEEKEIKPLGLDVRASGGAAVFMVLLAYFYLVN